MPKMFPHSDAGLGPGPTARTPGGSADLPGRWFWEPREWAPDERDARGRRRRRFEPHAAWAALLGLAGLVALVIGQTHHFGGATDVLIAMVALGGTIAALVWGSVGLTRIRDARGELRGRGLASIGVAEAWLAVLVVLTFGLVATAAR